MIVLFTDFGLSGPYVGQMKAVLHRRAPSEPVIDLFADAPPHNIRTNAYLLAAYSAGFEAGTVFLAVVDPGVGSGNREPVVVTCDGRWYVGPDNGLFDIVTQRASEAERWLISWRPENLSGSFHGRDLFAPVAAQLATGELSGLEPSSFDKERFAAWSPELAEIIYIDHFGNLISGIRAATVAGDETLCYQGCKIPRVATFADVATGAPLCYENSNGLLEIALNQGRAADHFSARVGDAVTLCRAGG